MTGTPSPAQIADLLAWARRLIEADPTDRAAYLAAKADLLRRLTEHPHDQTHEDCQ